MRKTTFALAAFSFAILLCLVAGPTSSKLIAQAQSPTKATPDDSVATPKEPAKLVALARGFNGLNVSGFTPWHLKATFTRFDVMGNPLDHGTYEEFWASPTKSKQIFAGAAFATTTFYIGDKILFTGSYDEVPDLVGMLDRAFIDPLPEADAPFRFSWTVPSNDSGRVHLSCVFSTYNGPSSYTTGSIIRRFDLNSWPQMEIMNQLSSLQAPSPRPRTHKRTPSEARIDSEFCFDADRPLLRVSYDALGLRTVRNNVILFNERYIPRDVFIGQSGKVELKAHLDIIEELKTINESDFVAPHHAAKPKYYGFEYLPQAKIRKLQIKSVEPQNPPVAVAARVFGAVHIRATIGTDGRVSDLHVIDGPPLLQQAALDAVSKYLFKPYYQDDRLSYVGTIFQVDFPSPADKK